MSHFKESDVLKTDLAGNCEAVSNKVKVYNLNQNVINSDLNKLLLNCNSI
jgi:hypothetical protein